MCLGWAMADDESRSRFGSNSSSRRECDQNFNTLVSFVFVKNFRESSLWLNSVIYRPRTFSNVHLMKVWLWEDFWERFTLIQIHGYNRLSTSGNWSWTESISQLSANRSFKSARFMWAWTGSNKKVRALNVGLMSHFWLPRFVPHSLRKGSMS